MLYKIDFINFNSISSDDKIGDNLLKEELNFMPNNLIESYETFELFWKTLQKYMEQLEMLDELGPGSVIRTAYQYEIIDDGHKFMAMLKDRNLITYTYKEDVAEDIYLNIKNEYIETTEEFIEKFDKKMKK